MVRIEPFAGYLPPPELALKLIVPPYDVVNSEEARAIAEGNDICFFHVDKPEIDLPPETDVYSDEVYLTGKKNLKKFVRNGWLVRDSEERFYIYSLEATIKGEFRRQVGIYVAASCEDYAAGKIKKHELTLYKKERDRTRLTDTQGANQGPVFLTYSSKPEVNRLVVEVTEQPPYYDVVTSDNVRHRIWKVDHALNETLVRLFEEVEFSYIADGHHRAASAFNVARMRRDRFQESGEQLPKGTDSFCAIMYPDDQLKVLDYNRLLKDLNGKSIEQILTELAENFEVSQTEERSPQGKGFFSLFLGQRWYRLKIKEGVVNTSDPIASLDVQILSDLVLKPIFGISDLTSSQRIDFVGGIRGLNELERRCNSDCQAAIAVYPVSIKEVVAVADANSIMPPKSTWFEPKPRSGTVVRIFDQALYS